MQNSLYMLSHVDVSDPSLSFVSKKTLILHNSVVARIDHCAPLMERLKVVERVMTFRKMSILRLN